MKIVFFGSSAFAVPALEAICSRRGLEVVLVVTQPDRKKGRSLKVASTPVKQAALKRGITVFQPVDVNSRDSIEFIKQTGPDYFVVVSFGQILKKELLEAPSGFAINIHASLLPAYRGAAPVNYAIANGEKETGVTVIKMNEKMDEGDIIAREKVGIDKDDDAITLSEKLSERGAELILDVFDMIASGNIVFERQDSSRATYAPLLKKEDGLIDWALSAKEINNKVRAFVPWPGAFTHLNGRLLKIWKADAAVTDSPDALPGSVADVSAKGIAVHTGDGCLVVKELQVEGKRRMTAGEYIAGHRDIAPGVRLGT